MSEIVFPSSLNPDMRSSSAVLYARISEMEDEVASARRQLKVLQRQISALEPVARMYVAAFAEDEMMTLTERLRLQGVEAVLKELDPEWDHE